MEKVAVLVNSKHKHRLNKDRLEDYFKPTQLQFYYSKTSGDLYQLTITALQTEVNTLVIVGGDGSVNEVVSAVVKNKANPSIFILPKGTGNDYIRSINGRQDVRFLELENKQQHFVAANIFDVGFGGFVIRQLTQIRKLGLSGKVAYVLSIIWSFLTFRKKEIELKIDGLTVYKGKTLLTAFCKGKVFGYGLTIHPEAKVSDENVYVTLIGDVSLFDYVRHLGRLKKGHKIEHTHVHYFKGKECELILTSVHSMYAEFDGESKTVYSSKIRCTHSSYAVQLLSLEG